MTGCFLKGPLLLLHILGFFANGQEEKWTFTFPEFINAVKHSDVEIPCRFTAPADCEEVRIVWYKYSKVGYPIVYSEDQRDTIKDYRGRTALIRNGTNSCTLKIKDVMYTAQYYPGVNITINSYDLNKDVKKRMVRVHVSGCSQDFPCNDWRFSFPYFIDALKGSCVDIPCKLTYPEDIQRFTLFWYKNVAIGYPKIFNGRTPTDVEAKYKGRTSLLENSPDTCSLRIDNVQEAEEIYPGINEDINSYHLHRGKFCQIYVVDSPPSPLMEGTDQMREKEPVNITCSVNHTCPSSPPSIAWNKPDGEVLMSHEDLKRGIWRIKSTLKHIPSYRDDKTRLECTVTFPNKKTSSSSVILDLKYKPRDVTISVLEKNQDDTLTLNCSSQANPPVTTYTWYMVGKTKTPAGSGVQITVKNVTSEKYICSARNDIGCTDSPEFSFIDHTASETRKHQNSFIIGGIAGLVALIIIVLGITFFLLKRGKRTKVFVEEKSKEETVRISEQIMMENTVYANMDEASKPTSTRFWNSDNGEGRKELKPGGSIIYTAVDLPPVNYVPKSSIKNEDTEYAELNI